MAVLDQLVRLGEGAGLEAGALRHRMATVEAQGDWRYLLEGIDRAWELLVTPALVESARGWLVPLRERPHAIVVVDGRPVGRARPRQDGAIVVIAEDYGGEARALLADGRVQALRSPSRRGAPPDLLCLSLKEGRTTLHEVKGGHYPPSGGVHPVGRTAPRRVDCTPSGGLPQPGSPAARHPPPRMLGVSVEEFLTIEIHRLLGRRATGRSRGAPAIATR